MRCAKTRGRASAGCWTACATTSRRWISSTSGRCCWPRREAREPAVRRGDAAAAPSVEEAPRHELVVLADRELIAFARLLARLVVQHVAGVHALVPGFRLPGAQAGQAAVRADLAQGVSRVELRDRRQLARP